MKNKLFKMNVLELKGELLDMISSIHNEEMLLRLKKAFKQATQKKDTGNEYLLTFEQEQELLQSVKDSYIEENVIDIEEAKKMHAKWLNR